MIRRIIAIIVLLAIIVGGYFAYQKHLINQSVSVSTDSLKKEKTKYKTENHSFDEEVPIYTDIPVDKVWEFEFTKTLDKNSINSNTIKVLDSDNKEVAAKVFLNDEGNKISINPPQGNYQKGATYHLLMSKEIKYVDGTNVVAANNFDFSTIRDEVEKGTLRKGLIKVKKEQLKSISGNTIKLSKSVKKDLKKEDILIIPSDTNPEGEAVKVVTVKKGFTSYTITVKQPHFAELFENLDIYKSYTLTPENIQLNKEIKGLKVQRISDADISTSNLSASGTNQLFAQPLSNNTSMSLMNFSSKSKDKEFELPKMKIDRTDGFKIDLENVQITDGKTKIQLGGSLLVADPKVNTDVDLSFLKIKKFQMISKQHTDSKLSVKFLGKSKEGMKKITPYDKDVRIGGFNVPTQIPGVFITGGLYLMLRGEYSLTPEATVVFRLDEERGVIYKDGKTRAVKNKTADLDFGLKGDGEVKGELGDGFDFALSAFKVAQGGFEIFTGEQAEGGIYGGVNKDNGLFTCMKASLNTVGEGRLFVDILDDRIIEYKLLKKVEPPKFDIGNCEMFQKLSLDGNQQTLNSGDSKVLELKGNYVDLSDDLTKEKELEDEKNITITSSNDNVVTGSYTDGKLIIKAADSPAAATATITVAYKEKSNIFEKDLTSKVEIPVVIKDFTDIKLDGEWTRNMLNYEGKLNIKNATNNSFDFDLNVHSGGDLGEISGKATIKGKQAVFTESEYGCRLDFTISKDQIKIEQNFECQNWAGMGVEFTGDYDKGGTNIHTDLIKQGILQNNTEDKLFRSVVGNDYDLFLNEISSYSEDTDLDGLNTRVVKGFVKGVAMEMAGIIMINDQYVYAAVINEKMDSINYYTNDPNYKAKIPNTIQEWSTIYNLPMVNK